MMYVVIIPILEMLKLSYRDVRLLDQGDMTVNGGSETQI